MNENDFNLNDFINFFLILSLIFFLIINNIQKLIIIPKLKYFKSFQRNLFETFIFNLNYNSNNSNNIKKNYEIWGKSIIESTYLMNLIIITYNQCNFDNFSCLNIKIPSIYNNFDFIYYRLDLSKFISSIKFSLLNSDSDWIIFTNENSILNIEKFINFLKKMNKIGNPRENPIIFGHCIDSFDNTYLDDNIGLILSRKSANLLVYYSEWLIHFQFSPLKYRLNDFFHRIGLRFSDISSSYLLSNNFKLEILENLINHKLSTFLRCPKFNPQYICGSKFHSLNDIFLYNLFNITNFKYDIFKGLPNNLFWFYENNTINICFIYLFFFLNESIRKFY